jgi:hypothetical protein
MAKKIGKEECKKNARMPRNKKVSKTQYSVRTPHRTGRQFVDADQK